MVEVNPEVLPLPAPRADERTSQAGPKKHQRRRLGNRGGANTPNVEKLSPLPPMAGSVGDRLGKVTDSVRSREKNGLSPSVFRSLGSVSKSPSPNHVIVTS